MLGLDRAIAAGIDGRGTSQAKRTSTGTTHGSSAHTMSRLHVQEVATAAVVWVAWSRGRTDMMARGEAPEAGADHARRAASGRLAPTRAARASSPLVDHRPISPSEVLMHHDATGQFPNAPPRREEVVSAEAVRLPSC